MVTATQGFSDQASGLRRLFGRSPRAVVPLLSNPKVPMSGLLVEQLISSWIALGHPVFLIDAAETAQLPGEWVNVDLSCGIESRRPGLKYLAARGWPVSRTLGSRHQQPWLDEVLEAVPDAEVLAVHAGAADLARMFPSQALQPLVLIDTAQPGLTHAWAAMKWLAQRGRARRFDLLIDASGGLLRASRVLRRMEDCMQSQLQAAVRRWTAVDPGGCEDRLMRAALDELARSLMKDGWGVASAWPCPEMGAIGEERHVHRQGSA